MPFCIFDILPGRKDLGSWVQSPLRSRQQQDGWGTGQFDVMRVRRFDQLCGTVLIERIHGVIGDHQGIR